MTKRILAALITASIALSLSACGGGGSGAPATATPGGSGTPAAGGTTTPAATPTQETVAAPTMPAQSFNVSGASGNFKVDGMNMLFKYAGTASFALAGNGNKVWFNDGQALSTVDVSGSDNTLVFRPGATAASLNVAAGNTVYLPAGSAVKVEGGGTTKYYVQ